MAAANLILVGTKKGAFIIHDDGSRASWTVRGPFCAAWPINHVVGDPKSGAIYAGGGNEWFGPAVWKTTDRGATWTHSSAGLSYAEGETPIKSVWSLGQSGGRIFAGVEPAGLFASDDGGETWQHLPALRDHPSKTQWQPGGAGLILHTIVAHPQEPTQMWVGISAAGVFHTADGGQSWEPRNRGTRADYAPEEHRYPEVGQCVHSLVLAAQRPDRLYQQNHCGMYRSDDAGRNWTSIEAGLPSTFGFPSAAHPRDPDTLYLVPLNGDQAGRFMSDGKAAVWRTRDAGKTWTALRQGLPQKDAFMGVLRQAMATDMRSPAGVYFGASGGQLYASTDEGDTWTAIAQHLPAILSVETMAVDG